VSVAVARAEVPEDQLEAELRDLLVGVDAQAMEGRWVAVDGGEYLALSSSPGVGTTRREEQRAAAAKVRRMIALGAVTMAIIMTLALRSSMTLYVWGGVLAAVAALYTEPLVQRLRGDRVRGALPSGVLLLADRMIVRRGGRCSIIPRDGIMQITEIAEHGAAPEAAAGEGALVSRDPRNPTDSSASFQIEVAYRDQQSAGDRRLVLEANGEGTGIGEEHRRSRLAHLQRWLGGDGRGEP
jgi:hypothetical protein